MGFVSCGHLVVAHETISHILIPEIRRDPGTTILAFVYTHKENNDAANKIALQVAEDMRDGFMSDYEMSTTNKVPVIALRTDWSIESQGGAFSKPPDMLRSIVV